MPVASGAIARIETALQKLRPARNTDPPPPALVQRITRIQDRDLAATLPRLFAQHEAYGFFEHAFEGMKLLTGLGPDGRLEVQLAPYRRQAPSDRIDHGRCGCALCSPPDPEEKGLAWRNFVLWPNAYPHAPEKSEHLIIATRVHHGQSFDAASLADLLDYQRIAGGQKPVTLHYNGVAGNSQFHWHWQATHERLPLQRALDSGALLLEPLRRDPGGDVSTFSSGMFAGILVRGQKAHVVRWASEIVSRLERDPLSQGVYNMMLVPPRGGEFRLVIFPRRKLDKPATVEGYGPFEPGAYGLAGRPCVSRPAIPDNFPDAFLQAIEGVRLRPEALPWLESLRSTALPVHSVRAR